MKKKAQKKLAKAIKKGNCEKMAQLCKDHSLGVEASEELILRALYCKLCTDH